MRSSWYFLISWGPKSYVVRQLVRQLVNTMFIANNHDSFHLSWHKNFVKYQNVSKYHGEDCRLAFNLAYFINISVDVEIANSSGIFLSYFSSIPIAWLIFSISPVQNNWLTLFCMRAKWWKTNVIFQLIFLIIGADLKNCPWFLCNIICLNLCFFISTSNFSNLVI